MSQTNRLFGAFQSTPSVGRATKQTERACPCPTDFNPRPPWGGRRQFELAINCRQKFQSTPSVGRATQTGIKSLSITQFQSTPSVGRATSCAAAYITTRDIFQSTPSVGRATFLYTLGFPIFFRFQSTPSVGRATNGTYKKKPKNNISIHALRGEGDSAGIDLFL